MKTEEIRQRLQSQKTNILEYLIEGNPLTSLEAIELFGCTRLAAIIFALRKVGWNIEGKALPGNKGAFTYRLLKKGEVIKRASQDDTHIKI
jgi:hypothetical protein